MDFFTQQDQTRTRSLYLTFLFALAVLFVAVAVYFAVQLAMYLSMDKLNITMNGFTWFDARMFLLVTTGTLGVIGVGSLVKLLQLKKGGSYVAENLGGRRVNRLSADKEEKRLLNVVEEMAIASGVPVPQVYLMEKEAGINAFAAGYSPGDAAIAVTRGCLEKLNREQLQGVIAHEFSHVLNGDMRLNIRLIGFLYGIMVIAIVGRGLLRGSRRSRNNKGGGADDAAGPVLDGDRLCGSVIRPHHPECGFKTAGISCGCLCCSVYAKSGWYCRCLENHRWLQ